MLAELCGITDWVDEKCREGFVYEGKTSLDGKLKIPADAVYKEYLLWLEKPGNERFEKANRVGFGQMFAKHVIGVRRFQQRLPKEVSPNYTRILYYMIPQTGSKVGEILDL